MGGVSSFLDRRSRIKRRIAGVSVLLLAILFLGIYSAEGPRDSSPQAIELHRIELLGLSHIKEANIDLVSSGRALRQMVLAPTFVDRDEARVQIEQAMTDFEQEMAATRQNLSTEQEKRLLNEFDLAFENYKRSVGEAITLVDSSTDYQQKATAYVSGEPFSNASDSVDKLLHQMAAIKEEAIRKAALAITRDDPHTRWPTPGVLLGGILLGVAAGVLIGRSAKQPAESTGHVTGVSDSPADDQPVATTVRQEEITPAGACAIEESARHRFEPVVGQHIAPDEQASILVVEDSESSQEVTHGLLANAGCKVTVVNSGQEALELLEKNPYDVVLMNMPMPMTDGINATLEIRKNPAFDGLTIIAMTTGSTHPQRERCLAAGMNGHIAKPIDPEGLFRALMFWISPDEQHRIA